MMQKRCKRNDVDCLFYTINRAIIEFLRDIWQEIERQEVRKFSSRDMSLSRPPSPPEGLDTIEQRKPRKAWRRYVQALMLVLLVIPILVAWQLLNSRFNSTDPTVAGRPLSNPRTHLHVIALGDKAGTLYLGTHYGLFTSTDGGNTWPEARGELNSMMIMSIAVSPANARDLAVIGRPTTGAAFQGNLYFSADGGQFYAFYEYAGWYETRDMGRHWYAITSGTLSAMLTPTLLTDYTDPNHLYLGGEQGLYESRDDGRHWKQITAVSGNVLSLVASRTVPRVIFCSTEEGKLYRWREGDSQISSIAGLPMKSAPERLAIDPSGKILYGMVGRDLWSSHDGGTTWRHRSQFDRSDMVSLIVDPLNANHIYAGFFLPAKVVSSTDGGGTWQVLTE